MSVKIVRRGLPPRCHVCGHRRRRVVVSTSKKGAEPRLHKRPCSCPCHRTESP